MKKIFYVLEESEGVYIMNSPRSGYLPTRWFAEAYFFSNKEAAERIELDLRNDNIITKVKRVAIELGECVITKSEVLSAMNLLSAPSGYLSATATEKQLASSLEVYERRGEFDGSLESAIECLERAEYEIGDV